MAAASSGLQISSLQSLNLDLPPSCVEFAPAHPAYFLVGTYNLEKEEDSSALREEEEEEEEEEGGDGNEEADQVAAKKVQSRNGSIVVYQLEDGGGMTHVQTEAHPSAILDLHFQGLEDRKHVCGVVSSTGAMSIFSFAPESGKALPLKQLGTVRLPTIGEDVLFLSFCWQPSLRDVAAVTTSTGHVHLLKLDAGYKNCSTLHSPVISHELEAWCVAISPPPPGPGLPGAEGIENYDGKTFTLYSGGDDSTLRYTTCTLLKDGNDDEEEASHDGSVLEATSPYSPVKVSGHGAGVTAILPLPSLPSPRGGGGAAPAIVITGSYDDRIRAFAVAPLHETHGVRRVTQLAECDLGGGVWRLKLVEVVATAVEDGRKAEAGGVVAPGEGGQDENEEEEEKEEEEEEEEEEQEERGYEWKAVVLVSCMHAGARIVELLRRVRRRRGGDDEWRFRVLGRFEEHRSMNYGSDFQPCTASSPVLGGLRCVSTSFYDKLLCSWEFRP